MKRFFIYLILFLIHVLVFSQSNTYINKLLYPYSGMNCINSVVRVDSCYYTLNAWRDNPYPNNQGLSIIKLDNGGNVIDKNLWWDTLHIYYIDPGNSLIVTQDSMLVMCAAVRDSIGVHAILWKIDQNLDTLWSRNFYHPDTVAASQPGANVSNGFTALKQTWDNGFIIAGNYNKDCITNNIRSYLLKTDSLGNLEWIKLYNNISYIFDLEITKDSGFVFTDLNQGFHLVKTDYEGNVIWRIKPNNDLHFGTVSKIALSNNDEMYACMPYVYDHPYPNTYLMGVNVVKYNLLGQKIWDNKYQLYFSFEAYTLQQEFSIEILPDSNIIISGTSKVLDPSGSGEGSYKGVLIKLNQNGDSLWARYYGYGTFMDYCQLNDIALTDDGGFLCAGFHFKYPPGSADAAAWIIKLDSLGCDTPGCQYAGIPVYESNGEALNIYPNPAREVVNVEMAASCQLPALNWLICLGK